MGYALFGLLEIKEKEKGETRRELHTHKKNKKREEGATEANTHGEWRRGAEQRRRRSEEEKRRSRLVELFG